jgi:hypothetical protein
MDFTIGIPVFVTSNCSRLASPQVDDPAAAYGHCAGFNHFRNVHEGHIRGGRHRKPLAAEKFL